MLAIIVPLTIADVTRGSGHFNLAQGVVGCGVGVGAALSTMIAGHINDRLGDSASFLVLAGLAAIGYLVVLLCMMETRPAARLREPSD